MIIKIALSLLLLSFALFVSDEILLTLGISKAPELVTQCGLFFLFLALLLLVGTGLVLMVDQIIKSLIRYFSAHERIHRRLLFIEAKQLQLKQLFFFKAQQVNYFHEHHKKRLRVQDDRRQIKALLVIIDKDLQHIRNRIPKNDYLSLIHSRKQFYNDQNLNGLLELQELIAHHASHNESS